MPWSPLQPCAGGCGRRVVRGRCSACRRAQRRVYEFGRPNRHQRGLDSRYVALRPRVLAEETVCWRCGGPGREDDTVGHVIARKIGGQNVRENLHREHRHCNFAAGAR
jgi:HNH endonuclease